MASQQCKGQTKEGRRCRKTASQGLYCSIHIFDTRKELVERPIPSRHDKKCAVAIALMAERDMHLEQAMNAVDTLLEIDTRLEHCSAPLLPKVVTAIFSAAHLSGFKRTHYRARGSRLKLKKLKQALLGFPGDASLELAINHTLYVALELSRLIVSNRYRGLDAEQVKLREIVAQLEKSLTKLQRQLA